MIWFYSVEKGDFLEFFDMAKMIVFTYIFSIYSKWQKRHTRRQTRQKSFSFLGFETDKKYDNTIQKNKNSSRTKIHHIDKIMKNKQIDN